MALFHHGVSCSVTQIRQYEWLFCTECVLYSSLPGLIQLVFPIIP